ncbi:hypothetical protein Pcinc_011667 [Petrolisthes cinctipes]|uniref:Uncharacterized protein n=1 Tax=Petrolisthes cinctipes TaxID=88211 RepID=A0AAE1G6A6_PETCI|nr:hypothetical protein Pcinc_011667 [Petrolisthes cinctipes]
MLSGSRLPSHNSLSDRLSDSTSTTPSVPCLCAVVLRPLELLQHKVTGNSQVVETCKPLVSFLVLEDTIAGLLFPRTLPQFPRDRSHAHTEVFWSSW